ncbi:hypothetical protein BDR06DRAFT_1015189 [Suillus hirtellus]|nr:hypothetical protein BDR06DRAFT_1015189 [Suillus hirtellus]
MTDEAPGFGPLWVDLREIRVHPAAIGPMLSDALFVNHTDTPPQPNSTVGDTETFHLLASHPELTLGPAQPNRSCQRLSSQTKLEIPVPTTAFACFKRTIHLSCLLNQHTWILSVELGQTASGPFCGQSYLAHMRLMVPSPASSGCSQPTTITTSHGSVSDHLMVASSQPPATMWQGPSDASSTQSTDDRLSHAAMHRGQRSVTSGPFGHSLASPRRSKGSSSKRSVRSSTPTPDTPLVTFRLNLIPYSVTGTSSDKADPFQGRLKLHAAKLLPLQRRLQEYNLSFLVVVHSTTTDEPVW